MMTDRWLNYVLAVLVVAGLAGVAVYNQPRDREERAEFLDQPLAQVDDPPMASDDPQPSEEREPVELQPRADVDEADPTPDDQLGAYGVSASHPDAVDVGMEVLAEGGNAVDAAVAVAYTLGVVEPFGSGIGGGGAMLVHVPDEGPRYYDYREIAPANGQLPPSDVGVPGFVAGMAHVHAEHGTLDLSGLIDYAVRFAEEGVEVDEYLYERLEGATHRLPIHLLPRLFPDGQPIAAGQTLYQPEYAEALRTIRDEGLDAMYQGELAAQIVEVVDGLEPDDLAGYEVMESEPSSAGFAGYELLSGGAPVSGPAVLQLLQIAEELGIADGDPDTADGVHLLAQSWRQADAQRAELIGDPSTEEVDLDAFLDPARSGELAAEIPDDGFVTVDDPGEPATMETDTTHVVVVDRHGTMVSMTNTLSNFFGSGLPVSGFFLNDQLKNFSPEPDSINHPAPGKRPRSFIAPTIVLEDDEPVLGIGTPGGRRIPNVTAQVLVRWAAHGQSLEEAVLAPRFHLEDETLEVEQAPDGAIVSDLTARGYEVTPFNPTAEYYGGVQALLVDHGEGRVEGVEDPRRTGTWAAGE